MMSQELCQKQLSNEILRLIVIVALLEAELQTLNYNDECLETIL